MTTDDYRFDIAFSFLAEDEPLAQELSDALQDRLEVFIYSKKQEELAGTDGEETFNRVFGCEARTVAVLYRENWGWKSPPPRGFLFADNRSRQECPRFR